MNSPAADKLLYDFQTATNTAAWQIVNDDVMGGVSASTFRLTNGVALFRGDLSLENNGGFASVRSVPARHELAGCGAFVIRVRGDGRRYKFTARTDRSFDSPIYQGTFTTKKGEWEEHRIIPVKIATPDAEARSFMWYRRVNPSGRSRLPTRSPSTTWSPGTIFPVLHHCRLGNAYSFPVRTRQAIPHRRPLA